MAKRKQEEASAGCPGWMATFGDLMNLLLCFFVLLFSMSTVDADKFEAMVASLQSSFSILPAGGSSIGEGQMVSSGVSQLKLLDIYYTPEANSSEEEKDEEEKELKEEYQEEALKESEKMAESVEQQLTELQIGDQVEVDANAEFVRMTLNGALLFDTGNSEVREDALPLVAKIAQILQNYNSNIIDIEGHTDNVPMKNEKYKSNDILSSFRAHSVKDYVLSQTSLEPGKIRATGCGEYSPIADNSTPEGRARNRRVEVKIYNSYNSN